MSEENSHPPEDWQLRIIAKAIDLERKQKGFTFLSCPRRYGRNLIMNAVKKWREEADKMKKGFTLVEVMIVMVILGIGACIIAKHLASRSGGQEISRMGYNLEDVRVFLRGTPYTTQDFLKSESLRKQYDAFKKGIDTDHMRSARAKAATDEAEATATIALGMAAGMAGSR